MHEPEAFKIKEEPDRIYIDRGLYRLELPLPNNRKDRLLIQRTILDFDLWYDGIQKIRRGVLI